MMDAPPPSHTTPLDSSAPRAIATNNVTSFTLDPAGRVLAVSNPLSEVTTFTYDADGRLLSTEDANSNTSSSSYDAAGQVASTTDGRGKTTTFTYTDGGYLETASDPEARTITRTYDLLGRLTTVADSANNVTTYSYDANGHLLSTALPSTAATTATFDAAGQTTSTTDANGKTATYVYDAAGQLVAVTDPLNRETSTTYTDDGQVDTVTLPDLSTQSYTYNENGQVATFADPDGHLTSYNYSNAGLLTQKTAPGSVMTSYDYDAAGRLRTTTLPDATTITNSYDDGSRLTERDYSAPGSTDVTFTYDSVGARLSMSDASGTTAYSYNANGQLTSETNAANQTLSYSYTDSGLLETVTYPGSDTVDYAYDTAGRLASVTDWNSNTTSFTWTVDGQRSVQADPNGVVQTRAYDSAGQVTDITTADALTDLAQYGYSYDDGGQLTGDTTTDPIWSAVSHTYTYDALNQVLSNNDGTTTVGYGATSGGKLITNGDQSLAYDSAQRLTDITPVAGPTTSFTYDNNGSRTNRTVAASTPDPAQSTDYTYDAALNLETVTLPGDITPTVAYVSNGDGLRQTRTESTTTNFLWSTVGGIPILLDDGSSRYIYGATATPIAQIDGLGIITYLHDDLLGSVRLITDDDGNIVGTSEFDTYGQRLQRAGGTGSAFGYTGNWTDSATGLVYLRARDYDSATGQFTTIDPMVDLTRAPYAYVGNNPLATTDPLGLCAADQNCYDGTVWEAFGDNAEGQMILAFLGNRNNMTGMDYRDGSQVTDHLEMAPGTLAAIDYAQFKLTAGDAEVGDRFDAGYTAFPDTISGLQNLIRDAWTMTHWADSSDTDRLLAAMGTYNLTGTLLEVGPHCAVIEFTGTNDMTLGSAAGLLYKLTGLGPSYDDLNAFADSTGRFTRISQTFSFQQAVSF